MLRPNGPVLGTLLHMLNASTKTLTWGALLMAWACNGVQQPAAPPDIAEESQRIAEIFETSESYSRRVVDSTELRAFLVDHPEHHADSANIMAFYQRRDMQFAWIVSDSLSAAADAFITLANVPDTTMPGANVLRSRIANLYDQGFAAGRRIVLCDSCANELELRLTAEFFRFAEKKYGGFRKGDLRELDWFIPRGKKDPNRLLDSLAKGKMDLSAYEPVHPQYRALKEQIKRYHDLAALPWPAIAFPEGRRKLEPGDSLEVVTAIRERLVLLGDMANDDGLARYDSTMLKAVQRFQTRHGLHPDGVIGQGFLKAMNVPMRERLLTMLVNMERLRWVPEHQAKDLLLVNIPAFKLYVYDEGELALEMGVVVGKRATRTVIFSDTLSIVVFSPTWTVPPGIMRRDVLPAMKKDPDYLRKNNMEVIGGTATNPIVRQRPGPNNAMGRVKFLFPNSYDIYLHDTPAKSYFAREQRAFSNGCIRVSKPRELAELLLRDESDWSPERISTAMNADRETHVRLKHRRPVSIGYFTTWVDGEDLLNFREDVYGHDDRLMRELFQSAPGADLP